MKTPPSIALIAFALGGAAMADETEISRSYTYSDPAMRAQDEACVAAIREKIAPKFQGLTQINLNAHAIFDVQGGALATYADVSFSSIYNEASGALSCVFAKDLITVTDVMAVFKGKGLAGFKKHPFAKLGREPHEWTVTATGAEVRR